MQDVTRNLLPAKISCPGKGRKANTFDIFCNQGDDDGAVEEHVNLKKGMVTQFKVHTPWLKNTKCMCS